MECRQPSVDVTESRAVSLKEAEGCLGYGSSILLINKYLYQLNCRLPKGAGKSGKTQVFLWMLLKTNGQEMSLLFSLSILLKSNELTRLILLLVDVIKNK
jgi:hypothetical protein